MAWICILGDMSVSFTIAFPSNILLLFCVTRFLQWIIISYLRLRLWHQRSPSTPVPSSKPSVGSNNDDALVIEWSYYWWGGTTLRDTRNLTFMFSYLLSLSLSNLFFSHSIQSSTNYKPLWLHFLSLFFNLQLFILIHLFYKKIYLISRWKHITRYQMWKTESRYFAVNVKIWRKI